MARRIRVLYMIGFLSDNGGAERFALGLATHLPRDRFEPWVCAPRGAEPLALEALAEAGIPFIDLGRKAKWDVYRLAGLFGVVRRHRFDVVHTHMFGSNLWGTLTAATCRVPVVIAQEHTWSYEGSRWRVWLDRHVIGRLATRFVAVSRNDAEQMVEIEKIPTRKVTYIPTAYLRQAGDGLPHDLRTELGLPAGAPLYGSASNMRPQKALEVMLDAHVLIREQIPDAHLVLAGGGPALPALQQHARELSIEDSAHFLGVRSDVDSMIRCLDVAAMSSDFEGMPLFALECFANGTPLVATAVGGLTEIVDDGRTGLLVPPRRPDLLAGAITELIRDPARRERLATAATAELSAYDIDTIAGRWATLYEQLLGDASPATETEVAHG
ncbi:MAG TPA: glycosyltransferase [Solirubrobacteraceae bacterium]|jgi:glycosyltransferase involved in cell wall biosynthesis